MAADKVITVPIGESFYLQIEPDLLAEKDWSIDYHCGAGVVELTAPTSLHRKLGTRFMVVPRKVLEFTNRTRISGRIKG